MEELSPIFILIDQFHQLFDNDPTSKLNYTLNFDGDDDQHRNYPNLTFISTITFKKNVILNVVFQPVAIHLTLAKFQIKSTDSV